MQAAKLEAPRVLAQLPEGVDMEEIIYRLYALENIRKGREDAVADKVISTEELKPEIEQW